MKAKDAFLKLKEQGKIESPEYETFLNTLPDFEFPEPVFQALEDKFFTIERAKADPTIQSHYKAQTLNGVDAWIAEGVKDQMWPSSILDEKDTFKRLKMIRGEVTNEIQRLKNKPGDTDKDKKIGDLSATVDQLTQKINSMTSEYTASRDGFEKDYRNKVDALELDYAIRGQADQYVFADEYSNSPEIKEVVRKAVIDKVKGGGFFSLKDGQIKVWENESRTSPKLQGNSEVTFKSLLDKAVEPYIKKNNGKPDPQKPNKPTTHITEKATLRELRTMGATTSVNGTI